MGKYPTAPFTLIYLGFGHVVVARLADAPYGLDVVGLGVVRVPATEVERLVVATTGLLGGMIATNERRDHRRDHTGPSELNRASRP